MCSGGIGGSEGAVTLSVEGTEANVKKALDLVNSLKNEPPTSCERSYFVSSPEDYKFDANEQLLTLGGM